MALEVVKATTGTDDMQTEVLKVGEKAKTETLVTQIVDWGIEETKRKYGPNGSEKEKPFHGGSRDEYHAKVVHDAAMRIAAAEGFSRKEIDALEMAAGAHDIETGLGLLRSEEESARMLAEKMSELGFGKKEIVAATRTLLATRFSIDPPGIKQMVDDADEMLGEYRIGLMERVMADADLWANGASWDQYEEWSKRLGREFGVIDDAMTNDRWITFWKWQEGFLVHRIDQGGFFTEGAKRAFPHMADNLEKVKAEIKRLGGFD